MATHQVAIAKAAFSASLLRPDPTSATKDHIAKFHSLLNSVVLQCTSRNVQECKQWILENVVHSLGRVTALGKYLSILVSSFVQPGIVTVSTNGKKEPSAKRKRLHVLYLISDILYHTTHRTQGSTFSKWIQPVLENLFGNAASFKACPKHLNKITVLLGIWEEYNYYPKDSLDTLREVVKNSSETGGLAETKSEGDGIVGEANSTKPIKAAPFVMPAIHGDVSTPWFDLPAANIMPHITPNSTKPINHRLIKPLQFSAGQADEKLVSAVKSLLNDVQIMYGTDVDLDEQPFVDTNELGQLILLDENTRDLVGGEGYYGWSRQFCEKMERRRKGLDEPVRHSDRDGRSRSRSSSRGRKRRYSDSESGSSRSDYGRSRRIKRSRSSTRSFSPQYQKGNNGSAGQSRSRSPNKSPGSPQRSANISRRSENIPSSMNTQSQDYGSKGQSSWNPSMNARPSLAPNFNGAIAPPPSFQAPPAMPYNGYGAFNGPNSSYVAQDNQYGAWPPPPPPPPNMPFHHMEAHMPNWPPPPPPPGSSPGGQQPPSGYPPSNWHPPAPTQGRGSGNMEWRGPPGGHFRGGRGNYGGRGWSQ